MMEICRERESSYTVGGTANWCNHYGKQYRGSLKIKNTVTIWSSNPTPGHIPREKIHAPLRSQQHYLQQPRHGNNLNVHRQRNGSWWCGTYTWGILLSHKKNKMTFTATGMDPEIIILSNKKSEEINTIYDLYAESKIWHMGLSWKSSNWDSELPLSSSWV